jgi:hypothetical protein
MRNYVYYIAIVRYNAFIRDTFFSHNPMARASFIYKFRLFYHKPNELHYYVVEQFSSFIFFGKFVFFDRRRAFGRFVANVQMFSLFFVSMSHSSLLDWLISLKNDYLVGREFWRRLNFMYAYFSAKYVQHSPKKFKFTKGWVQVWDELFFMGSWWLSVAKKFRARFYFSYYERFISFLLHNKLSLDFRVCDCFISLDFRANFFTFWGRFFKKISVYNYKFDERSLLYNFGFIKSFSYFEMTSDNFDLFDYIADILFFTRFFLASFFRYVYPKGFIPFSYKLYIFWRIRSVIFVRRFAFLHRGLLFYFKRIQLDDFFFKRLRSTLFFFAYRISFMRITSGPFSEAGKAIFRRRFLFFFYLKDLSCRYMLHSKLLSFYMCVFFLFFFQRRFFYNFLYSSFLGFRFIFSRRFLLSYLKVLPEDFDFHNVTLRWFIPLRRRFRRRFYRSSAVAARHFYARSHEFYLLKWYEIFLLRMKSAKFEFL